MKNDSLYGYAFTVMSDDFLLSCFDELSEKTTNQDDEDLLAKWNAARAEIIKRMAARYLAEVAQ